jgi:CBS domain-containing protein
MKAASIALRIADFLKDYPPFEFFDQAELIELASTGRVRFHEDGETIFETGMPRDRFIYVIKQGRVRIVEGAAADSGVGAMLLDLRGPGELLGLHGVLTEAPYLGTAIAETEVLLYCLPRQPFLELTERSRRAKHYLLAYFSLNGAIERNSMGRSTPRDAITPTTLRRRGLAEVDPPHALAADALLTVRMDTKALDAARMLQPRRARCVIVVDAAGRPVGKLSDSDLRERFIEGRVLANETAGSIMMTDLAFARRTDDTGRLLIRLARSGKRYLIVTEDGTAQTKALGLVTERNIFMQYGRFPTLLAEAMREAPTIGALATLRDRMESLILEFIEDRSQVPWLMEIVGVLNRAIVARLEHLACLEMAAEGWRSPGVDHTWLIMGSGGRDELLIRSAVYHAILFEDPLEEEREYTQLYFRELGNIVSNGLRRCGFTDNETGILASNPEWCLSRSAMHARYSRMIADPVGNNVYAHRDAFDFRPIVHLHPLAVELRQHINSELQRHPEFLERMAKDSLLNQPPRTIFQQYVINEQGEQKEELAIKHHALLPLVDAARVLALAAGEVASTATYLRFRAAAAQLDDVSRSQAELLREAAEAFLVLACARAHQGLLSGTNGAVIRPADVDSETRPLLKRAFRTILSTLEYLASRYNLSMRP